MTLDRIIFWASSIVFLCLVSYMTGFDNGRLMGERTCTPPVGLKLLSSVREGQVLKCVYNRVEYGRVK